MILAWALATPQTAAADIIVPDDFNTITAALAAIEAGLTTERVITLEPATYIESVSLAATLPSGIVLRGRETARTVFNGTISINDAVNVRISNLRFTGGGPAVQISGGSATISNNVFQLAGGATAITITALVPDILNNVFYRGAVAIDAGGNVMTLENNVFVQNGETLINEGPGSVITHNAFFGAAAFGEEVVVGDPLFVDSDLGDFHLRTDSPLIDTGIGTDNLDSTTSDIGAYGGDNAEGLPYPVQGLDIESIDSDGLENSVTLEWSANPWYQLGGYRLYYDTDSGAPYEGTGADEGDSPIDIEIEPGEATVFTISGLTAADASAITPPVLAPPEPADRSLRLSWSESPDATGYVVHYRIDGADDESAVDVGNVTQYSLTGLENGTDYRVHVTAYIQRSYVFAVTAFAVFNTATQSDFSAQVTADIGPQAGSLPSNEFVEFPEAIIAFPDLPESNGCFIATAAFGFYGAAEVRSLRRFRDEYLMTHAPGRAFVAWYYRHSPDWAAALHEHPALKPLVRLALLPVIVMARFAEQVPPTLQWSMTCLALVLITAGVMRRRRIDTVSLR